MFEEFSSYSYINFSDIIFENELGRSNVSVFKGKLNSNDIAIKIYEVDTKTNHINENIINELYIGKIINSERLLKIIGYSYNDDETEYYLIMEYINSGSLFDYINKSTNYNIVLHNFRETNHRIINPYLHDGKKKGNKLNYIMSDKVKFSIALSLLKAARSMYDNKIIHGDMKTDNVVIQNENSNIYVKIIDYGTCHYNVESAKINGRVGTHGFYAPEQKDNILNHKSDIYSLGVIIAEIWSGDIWYNYIKNDKTGRNGVMKSLRMIKKDNLKLEQLLRKCVSLDYKKRPDIIGLYNDFIKLSQS